MYGAPVPTLCDPTPSPEDVHVTELVVQAGELLGIAVLDHLDFHVAALARTVAPGERALGIVPVPELGDRPGRQAEGHAVAAGSEKIAGRGHDACSIGLADGRAWGSFPNRR